jgi:hypothetical protein
MFPASSLAVLLAGRILVIPAGLSMSGTATIHYKSPSQCEAALEKVRREQAAVGKRYPLRKLSPETEPYCTDDPGLRREPSSKPALSPGASRSQ